MPENYAKHIKKNGNILEEYVVEKYGSVNNFLSRLENLDNRSERISIESVMRSPDFLEAMQIGLRVCGVLRIDFTELFSRGNIREIDSDNNINMGNPVEERYSMLNLAMQQRTLEYMDNILEN